MTIYVPYFGTQLSWLLDVWLKQYLIHGEETKAVFLVAAHRDIPEADKRRINLTSGCQVVYVSHHVLAAHIRTRTEAVERMDTKEALARFALAHGAGRPALVIDIDAFLFGDPWNFAIKADRCHFGMARDPMPRPAGPAIEHNAGVLYFSGKVNDLIQREFDEAWNKLHNTVPEASVLLGQKAWSLAHYSMFNRGAFMLPDEMNWSRCWGPNPDAKIRHFHGPAGKEQLLRAISKGTPID